MRIPRIFIDQELTKNKTYKLDKDSFHHLLVIKKREGDKIEVFNSKGQFLQASISLINKKTCEIFSKFFISEMPNEIFGKVFF